MGDPLPEPDPRPGDGCCYYCSYFWIITNSMNGEITSVTVECDSDAWVYECNAGDGVGDGLPSPPPGPGGGGGGGSGGGCGDPGTPDAPHPCEYLLEPEPLVCGGDGLLFPYLSDDDLIQDSDILPNCDNEQEDPWKIDYCNSNEPSGTRLTKTNAALDNIEERGEVCINISEKGREILQDGHLRFFPRPNRSSNIAGVWGLPNVEDGVVLLMDEWIDNWYNDSVAMEDKNGILVEVNFEFALVHEIEHAMGKFHISGSNWLTPNAKKCSGLN